MSAGGAETGMSSTGLARARGDDPHATFSGVDGPSRASGEPRTVFVVDDEPGIRNAITLTLERAGYACEGFSEAASLASALARATPFLIVLDVSLERSDAVEALQILSDHGFRGAVQLLSGTSLALLHDIRLIGERRRLRMLPAMTKPCRMEAIRAIADREASSSDAAPGGQEAPPARDEAPARALVSLDDAIDRERVEIWYQPKFDLRSGAMIGAECLSRVRRATGELVLPGSFLPGASLDTMGRLTELVLRRALADWQDFTSAGNALRLSVNVPSQLLATFPLAALLRACVPVADEWPGLLLEITEEDALRDVEGAHEAATQLMIYGVELSIDDFGLGYSSLSRLREIPFKEIKLDRSLVQDCATDKTRAALCKAVVELAHTLGAAVVAEGVETAADLSTLRLAGCDIGQGYLLGRPMPKADLIDQITSGDVAPAAALRALRIPVDPPTKPRPFAFPDLKTGLGRRV